MTMGGPRIPLGHVGKVIRAAANLPVPGAIKHKPKEQVSHEFTQQAHEKAALKRYRKQARRAKGVFTSCGVEIAPEVVEALLAADAVPPEATFADGESMIEWMEGPDPPQYEFKRARKRRAQAGKEWRNPGEQQEEIPDAPSEGNA